MASLSSIQPVSSATTSAETALTKVTHGLLWPNPWAVFNPCLVLALLGGTELWGRCSLPKRFSFGSTDTAHSGFSLFPAVVPSPLFCGPPFAGVSFKYGCSQDSMSSLHPHILVQDTLPLPWLWWPREWKGVMMKKDGSQIYIISPNLFAELWTSVSNGPWANQIHLVTPLPHFFFLLYPFFQWMVSKPTQLPKPEMECHPQLLPPSPLTANPPLPSAGLTSFVFLEWVHFSPFLMLLHTPTQVTIISCLLYGQPAFYPGSQTWA